MNGKSIGNGAAPYLPAHANAWEQQQALAVRTQFWDLL